jgi:CheY-like chemotaxis protein
VPQSRIILLVQPDDESRVTFQVILKREGYAVIEAADANGALEQIRESVPELVITEMRLPRASGGELIRTIRGDKSYGYVRIIAVGEENLKEEAKAAKPPARMCSTRRR